MLLVYRMSIPAFFLPDFEVYVREVSVRPGSFSIYFSKTECICQRERLTVHAGSAHDIDLLILLAGFLGFLKRGVHFCSRALGVGMRRQDDIAAVWQGAFGE